MLYTLLQHTDVDMPHLGERTKVGGSGSGAFMKISVHMQATRESTDQ